MRFSWLAVFVAAQDDTVLTAARVDQAPVLDGDGSDAEWAKAPLLKIRINEALRPDREGREVELRALVHEETLYLLVRWADGTKDDVHKPWIWDAEKKRYREGMAEEDAFSVGFPMEGEFNPNMLAYADSKWDVWHWKAARTNPAGYAMDRVHVTTTTKQDRGREFPTPKGSLWIWRPEDAGRSCTARTPAPASLQGDTVPQYRAQVPDGSAADVRARGAHKDGFWTVEFARRLRTGHADDVDLPAGGEIPFVVAAFDREEDDEHSVSGVLTLRLPK